MRKQSRRRPTILDTKSAIGIVKKPIVPILPEESESFKAGIDNYLESNVF